MALHVLPIRISHNRHLKPLFAGSAMTSWSYKSLPEDFIVIEDRVLEFYGQNISTQTSGNVDSQAPDVAQLELAAVLGKDQLEKLIALSQAAQSSWSGLESVTLKIFPALSKEERTKFHQNIRKIYPTVDSKTELKDANEEQRTSTYILIYPKGAKSLVNPNDALAAARYDENENENRRGGGRKKVVVQRWDRSKPDYLHFTVVKSMLSTSEMVDKLAKMTSMLPTRFEFSGSKDKRALTFQRVSSWRVDQDVLARVSTDSMLVRDVCIAPAPLHLGDLSGNFFAITLRKEEGSHMQNSLAISDQLSAANVLSAFSALAVYPFMNVFGVQRFGSPLPSNPEVGMRLLASDYRGAVLMLLLAPSTASELEIGKLDLELLNSWLNEAEKLENLSKNDENRQNSDIPNYFKYLSEKFEKYNEMLEDAIEEGKFNGMLSRSTVDDEKMGEDWNAMISKEEKIDSQNRESYSENVLDLKDSDQTLLDDDPSSLDDLYTTSSSSPTSSTTSSSSSSSSSISANASGTTITPKIKVVNQKQINAIRDIRDRLQCLSDLLKGRPFNIPKSASFLQKKILSQLYDEMAKKCDGDLSRVNFSRVFSVLPQALRQLFVNSYQSLLWNDVAIDRCNQNNKHNKNGKNDFNNDNNKDNDNHYNNDINQIEDNTNKLNDLTKCSIIELKSILREKGLKVSGNKSELVARLLEEAKNIPQQSEDSQNDNNNQKMKDNSNNNNNNNQHVSGFEVTDTAVVGDIVLVDLKKQPLTAWHVAAQNISLNGNQIPLWSKDVGIKVPVPQEIVNGVVISSNTPYNSNPNSPLYGMTKSTDYVGGSGDRNRDRDSREGDRGRGRRGSDDRNEVEEKDEVKEIKACYHLVTSKDETLRLYPVESVIIALPGASVFNPSGGRMMQRIEADKMQVLLTGMHHDKIFRLPGAYRHLVTLAKNVRVAPVHTPKRQQQSSSDDVNGKRDREEMMEGNGSEVQGDGVSEAVYAIDPPAWMTPADYLSTTSTFIPTSTTSLKSVEQTSSKKKGGKVGKEGGKEGEGGRGIEGDYPFSSQVEKMWVSDVIPRLLHDIYSTSSSALHSSNIGLLPSALTRAADGDQHSTHAESHSTSHNNHDSHTSEAVDRASSSSSNDSSGSSDRDGDRNEMEGLRISFSLCASTYATTFLDHLVDTLNKDVLRK